MALVVHALLHWLSGTRVKVSSPITGFVEAVGDRLAFEPPFANEGAPALLDLGSGGRVDHVVIVGRNLLMQALADVGKQVAILVDGAALGLADGDRRTCRPRRRFS